MLLLSLALFACQPTKTETDDTGPVSDFSDADGDGYATEVDCDDADAAVNPGAAETWYDGVDQDCDGNDDDQDGDGFDARVDCDDTDPASHPDAGEVPDDGVDQDCDGSDATGGGTTTDDHDSDGYATFVDCDDADVTVHPGATEIWYDGADEDCSGGGDFDQDGDGYDRDEECDDLDPARYPDPEVVEVWYDGVDDNCDGNDGDRDGDGYFLAGYPHEIPAGYAPGDCADDPGETLAALNGGDDLAVMLARVEPAGGSIVVPKTEIGNGFGFFAHFLDTEGNKIGLHSMQ